MKIEIAVRLIEKGVEKTTEPQVWADFGAGEGLFTKALATLLSKGSTVYAIDKDASSLNTIRLTSPGVVLKTIEMDFAHDVMRSEPLDGILMANALHYVSDALPFLKTLKKSLKPSGRILLVEYDRTTGNQWVPYPVSFTALRTLAGDAGFTTVEKLGEVPSVYHHTAIYAALMH